MGYNRLLKQLEDKKKGCNKWYGDFRCKFKNLDGTYEELCPICKAEIAILEQAIAEIEKRDKAIIDQLSNIREGVREYHLESDEEFAENFYKDMSRIIEQLQSQQTSKEIVSSSELANADISNLLQKQRQEILDIYNKISELQRRANFFYLDEKDLTNKKYERGQYDAYHNVLRLFEQLNQPKTEQDEK